MFPTYTWTGEFCKECEDCPPIFSCSACGLIKCERDETPSFLLVICPECGGNPHD